VAGLAAVLGSGAMTNSIEEIEGADCILIIGSNTSIAHPLIATRVFRAKAKGAKIIVADPRRIPIVLQSDLHLQQNLGTDVALINGLMHIILKNGWQDQAFIDERTENFEQLKKLVDNYPPEKVSGITGIPAADLEKAAEYYAKAERASILYTMGITQHTTGVDNVKSLANLAMLTGNLGKESTGINPLRGQNNVQGACDMGGLPNVYTGYQAVIDQAVRQKFEGAWGAKLPDKIGLTATEMFPAVLDGKMKAIVILGENPVVSDADSLHVEKALKALDFLLVIDIFNTPTSDLAHVVLPGAAFAEKEGTFSNTERRVQLLRKAVEPPGESKPDWQIIQELSSRFGYPMDYVSPRAIMEEIAKLTPSYGGITFDRLQGDGLQWPCPNTEHPGTKFLHQGRFTRGKGLFSAIEYKPAAETADEEYPFQLTTGRIHVHYHTGTMTRNSPSLEREIRECFLEMHPEDAAELKVMDGDWVVIASRRGSVPTRVKLTDGAGRKTVFMPFHFLESRANILTNPAFDPIAKIPEYKVCAVKIQKMAPSDKSISSPTSAH
jgi:formate dehydrogenase major subunit